MMDFIPKNGEVSTNERMISRGTGAIAVEDADIISAMGMVYGHERCFNIECILKLTDYVLNMMEIMLKLMDSVLTMMEYCTKHDACFSCARYERMKLVIEPSAGQFSKEKI